MGAHMKILRECLTVAMLRGRRRRVGLGTEGKETTGAATGTQ
jgi:hypothetical protein